MTLREGNIFKTIYLNFFCREALEDYAILAIKGAVNTDLLVEEDIIPHMWCTHAYSGKNKRL